MLKLLQVMRRNCDVTARWLALRGIKYVHAVYNNTI